MTTRRLPSAAELAVLERQLPAGMSEGMRDLGVCLFESLVLTSDSAGAAHPSGAWSQQLQTWAELVLTQLRHLSAEMGGIGRIYISKGLGVQLSARNQAMCARFTGKNYRQLAIEYGLTEVQVRTIVDDWQTTQYQRRQTTLPLDS